MLEKQEFAGGEKLVARFKKQEYGAEVVRTADGVVFKLDDGTEHKSISAAAKAITGGSINGWSFWSLEGQLKPRNTKSETDITETAEAPTEDAKPAKAAKARTVKVIYKTRSQKEVPDGQERWYCNACADSFFVTKGETPQTCPQGHGAATTENLGPEPGEDPTAEYTAGDSLAGQADGEPVEDYPQGAGDSVQLDPEDAPVNEAPVEDIFADENLMEETDENGTEQAEETQPQPV